MSGCGTESIKILESFQSRDGSSTIDGNTQIDYTWRLQGSNDVDAMGQVLESIRPNHVIDPIWNTRLIPVRLNWVQVGHMTYDFNITYGNERFAEADRRLLPGQSRYGFTTSGYSERVTQSLTTVGAWNYVMWADGDPMPDALPAPNYSPAMYNNVVNFDLDGAVHGVEVVRRNCDFWIQFSQPIDRLTLPYINTLEALTGSVNTNTFMYCEPGSVLFRGSDASAERQVSAQGIRVTQEESNDIKYNFSWRPNEYNIAIEQSNVQNTDQIIVIPQKLGWEYLWFQSIDFLGFEPDLPPSPPGVRNVPPGATIVMRQLMTAIVEQVYPYTSFAALEIV